MDQPSHPNPTQHSFGHGEVGILQKLLGLPTNQLKGKETSKKDQDLIKRE